MSSSKSAISQGVFRHMPHPMHSVLKGAWWLPLWTTALSCRDAIMSPAQSLICTRLGVTSLFMCCRHVDTGGSGSGLYEENIAVRARLILHFDINKTILMSDKAQDASTDHMVNVLLCECAWGRLEPGPKWVPVGRLATDRYCQQPMTPACERRA